ncbi:MAG: hemerythrin family protein [Nitrospirae bacterium]|nr:hemerythrin family protein [Nitrospirota bacterium]
MAAGWTDELATELTLIDEQHQEIFRRVDGLLDACKKGKGKAEVAGTLSFLEDYVVSHFSVEEKIQKESGYPLYGEHKAMHDHFLSEVKALRERFDREGPSLDMVLQTNQVVVDWLINHIMKSDKALAGYIKKNG